MAPRESPAERDARAEAAEDRAGLQRAVEGRTVIGQAQGLLMATHGIDAEEAFALLVGESQTRNVKLLSVAQERVDSHTRSVRARSGQRRR